MLYRSKLGCSGSWPTRRWVVNSFDVKLLLRIKHNSPRSQLLILLLGVPAVLVLLRQRRLRYRQLGSAILMQPTE